MMESSITFTEIYLSIASIATIAIAGLLVLCLFYIISILHDIKKLSKLAKKEVEFIARNFEKGVTMFGDNVSSETAGFLKAVFSLLISQFGSKFGATRTKKSRIKSI